MKSEKEIKEMLKNRRNEYVELMNNGGMTVTIKKKLRIEIDLLDEILEEEI